MLQLKLLPVEHATNEKIRDDGNGSVNSFLMRGVIPEGLSKADATFLSMIRQGLVCSEEMV